MELRVITGSPPDLEAALAGDVAAAQASDLLAPVGVLLGGTLQRPYLARRLAELNEGIANVRFLMPSDLAMALGEHAMVAAGRRPLPPLADRILLREIAAGHDGYFAPVRDAPGLAEALHRLARELRGAGYDADSLAEALAGCCDVPGKEASLAELFAEFLARRQGFYGPDDCLLAADPDRAPWVSLHVHGLWQAPAALLRTLAALAERIPVTAYLPLTGSEDADSAHAQLRARLAEAGASSDPLPEKPAGGHGAPSPVSGTPSPTTLEHARGHLFRIPDAPAPELDGTLRLLSGPDPAREVREVARQLIAWAGEGIGFHEMAIAYRHPDPYRSTIEAVLGEAGIPVYLHEGTPLAERPLGRRALALLGLTDSDLDRRAVMDFLADGRLPKQTWERYGATASARWDRFSRRAGVVRGLEQWRERLATYRDELAASERDWQREDAERVEGLRAFIADLARDLQAHPAEAPFSEHLAWLERLLDRYVSQPEPLLGALAGLARFDALGARTTHERFLGTVTAAIENLRTEEAEGARAGAFGLRGVNALDVNSLRHLRFRAVAIVGVAERSFPAAPSPDPILLDGERERLNEAGPAPIPLRVRGADPEPLQFALAAHAARERLLVSYPRRAAADARPQLPSRFFRALAEAATAQRVPAREVDRLPGDLYERALGSRIGAREPALALGAEEYDRSLIEHDPDLGRAALARSERRLERAMAARRSRFLPALTAFDGVLGDAAREALPELFDPAEGVSPSLLESYAACPQRVFLDKVIRARREEEPEEIVTLQPAARGTLLHRIMERFLSEPPAAGDQLLHGAGEPERLMAIAEQELEACEARGEAGYPAAWRAERTELREDLRAWLAQERADEALARLPEGAYEVRFGEADRSTADAGLSQSEPLELAAGRARLRVSGRIDRLNWDPEGERFRVADYKTGSTFGKPKDGALGGGEALQLPLYLLAAARLLGAPPERGSAEYHYATRRGGFRRARFTGQDLASRRADLERLLAGIVGGISGGVFHMAPESRQKTCRNCDFDGLCPSQRERLVQRKSGAEPARAHLDLRGIE